MGYKFDMEVVCRLNGKKPTLRDMWYAFYRLHRIVKRAGFWHEQTAADCFHVWCRGYGFMDLANAIENVGRKDYPPFLRKLLLKSEKRRRLHGDRYEWLERDQRVACLVRQQDGLEVTPAEVAEVRIKLVAYVRAKALQDGVEVPLDDEALLKWVKGGWK